MGAVRRRFARMSTREMKIDETFFLGDSRGVSEDFPRFKDDL
jgi:hypothetical protein